MCLGNEDTKHNIQLSRNKMVKNIITNTEAVTYSNRTGIIIQECD
jgi:hypothetical protein